MLSVLFDEPLTLLIEKDPDASEILPSIVQFLHLSWNPLALRRKISDYLVWRRVDTHVCGPVTVTGPRETSHGNMVAFNQLEWMFLVTLSTVPPEGAGYGIGREDEKDAVDVVEDGAACLG